MRVRPSARPINGLGFSTIWIAGTGDPVDLRTGLNAVTLFLAAAGATLAIGFREPLADYVYESILFAMAALWCLSRARSPIPLLPAATLAGIGLWGFSQLLFGATVYRFATLQSSLRFAALGATAWVSFRTLKSGSLQTRFLRAIAWFGALVAVISTLAYFTSPGKILWIFDAPYPDIWGFFLSRNNFAQFLELTMPVALWLSLRERNRVYLLFAAVMLAAGLASASRAGSAVLLLEAVVLLLRERKSPVARRMTLGFVFATIVFAATLGVGTLAGRLTESDPFENRREIARSTLQMISSSPWSGFGLGTFPTVYPAYALFDVGQSVDHSHNDWLEWASEGGVVFCLLWIALAAWAVLPTLRAGWGLGVLGCFLHAIVDYPFARLGISAWVFILIGMLAATDLREARRRAH